MGTDHERQRGTRHCGRSSTLWLPSATTERWAVLPATPRDWSKCRRRSSLADLKRCNLEQVGDVASKMSSHRHTCERSRAAQPALNTGYVGLRQAGKACHLVQRQASIDTPLPQLPVPVVHYHRFLDSQLSE